MLISQDTVPEVVMTGAESNNFPDPSSARVSEPSILMREGAIFLLPTGARSYPSNNALEYPGTPVYYPLCHDRNRKVLDGSGVCFYIKHPGCERPARMFAPDGLEPGKSYLVVVWFDTRYVCVRLATAEEAEQARAVVLDASHTSV